MADVPSGVVDASSVSFMAGSGVELVSTDLSPKEQAILDRDLARLEEVYTRSSDLAKLYTTDRDTYLWAASIAKNQLGDIPFTGLLSLGSSTYGMWPIRSMYMGGNVAGAQTWLYNQTSTGWQTNHFNIDLSGTTAGIRNTQNRVILCIPRVANYAATPKVSGVRWTVGPTTYAVQMLEYQNLTDLYIAKLHGAVLIGKNGTATMNALVETTGVDGLAAWGMAFGTGDWANQQT